MSRSAPVGQVMLAEFDLGESRRMLGESRRMRLSLAIFKIELGEPGRLSLNIELDQLAW